MSSLHDLPKQISELYELVVEYVKSQTINPLKRLGRYIGMGIVGALFISTGLILVSIGFLRYLQTLSVFDDTYSFVPYIIVSIVVLAVIGLLFAVMNSNSLIKPRKQANDD